MADAAMGGASAGQPWHGSILPSGRRTFWARVRRRLRPPRRLSFTREGRIIVIMAIALGFAAINTGNNLLYLLLGWVLSFIVASGVLSELSMRGLMVERRPPPKVVAGQPFLMELAICNHKPKLASFSIEVEDTVDGRPIDKRCYFLKIPPNKTQRTSYRHTIMRRGRYRLDGYRIATRFPFGLFRKSRDVDAPTELLVYPPLVPVTRPPPAASARGESSAPTAGRRGEFFGLREHRPGDDRRDVHWRSTARSGRVMVREYQDEHTRRVTVVLDNALPQECIQEREPGELAPPAVASQLAAFERAVSYALSLCTSYLAAGYAVELFARGLHVPADSGRAQEARLARELALVPAVAAELPLELPHALRHESVLIAPAGVPAAARPPTTTTVEV